MVKFFSVVGCKSQYVQVGIRFFRVPKVNLKACSEQQQNTKKRLLLWIKQLKKGSGDIDNKYVCSKHFHPGKPVNEETNPDWVPSLIGHHCPQLVTYLLPLWIAY